MGNQLKERRVGQCFTAPPMREKGGLEKHQPTLLATHPFVITYGEVLWLYIK